MGPTQLHYTLTGAADWPMLATVGGISFLVLQATILILIGVIYRALPKHQDLQNLRTSMVLDIEKLANRFEGILDKYMATELAARLKREDDIISTCEKQRAACQARYDRMFENHLTGTMIHD